MPKVTRSEEEVELVREQILEGALYLLESYGFDSLSMSKLGSRMDMTAANLYNYYGNKHELLIAIHKKTFGMLGEYIQEAVESVDDPAKKVKALIESFVGFGLKNVHIYDLMFNRHIPQYTDYIGTPQEDMAYDEYQSSLNSLIYAVKTVSEFIQNRPDLHGTDAKFLTIRILSELHGIISLYNSRVLFEMDSNPDEIFERITDGIFSRIEKGVL